jgi:hypothetical protein
VSDDTSLLYGFLPLTAGSTITLEVATSNPQPERRFGQILSPAAPHRSATSTGYGEILLFSTNFVQSVHLPEARENQLLHHHNDIKNKNAESVRSGCSGKYRGTGDTHTDTHTRNAVSAVSILCILGCARPAAAGWRHRRVHLPVRVPLWTSVASAPPAACALPDQARASNSVVGDAETRSLCRSRSAFCRRCCRT